MKKLMAVILAAAMLLSLATVAMADDSTQKSEQIELSYTVPESFEWAMSESIPMDLINVKGESYKVLSGVSPITITKAVLLAGNTIAVDVSSANGGKLVNGNVEIPYTVYFNASEPSKYTAKDGHLYRFKITDGAAEALYEARTGSDTQTLLANVAGSFSDSVTFTVSIVKDYSDVLHINN